MYESREYADIDTLLDKGDNEIIETSDKSVLLLGNTGAGKSTVLALLAGIKLKSIYYEENGELVIALDNDPTLKGLEIGHSNKSCTSIPTPHRMDAVFWDCPGFEDNNSLEQEIANAYYITRIDVLSKTTKFVLVIPHGIEKASRGNILVELFIQISSLVPELKRNIQSLSIIITKCPPDYQIEHFIDMLKRIVRDNNRFDPVRVMVEQIIQMPQHIAIFNKPDKNKCNIDPDNRQCIFNAINSTQFIKTPVKCILGPTAQNCINQMIENINEKIINQANSCSQQLFNRFNVETNMQVLAEAKQMIKNMTKSSISLEEFRELLHGLSQFICNIDDEITKIRNLIMRQIFYQEYTTIRYNYNLMAWKKPFKDVSLKIQGLIDFNNEENRKKQAEELKEIHRKEVEELKNLTRILKESLESSRRKINEDRILFEATRREYKNRLNEMNIRHAQEMEATNERFIRNETEQNNLRQELERLRNQTEAQSSRCAII